MRRSEGGTGCGRLQVLQRHRRGPISIVEIFNNGYSVMATMNFSIPDDVKEAFNKAFDGQNKSAVITGLMRKALEDRRTLAIQPSESERRKRFDAAIERIESALQIGRSYTDEEISRARKEGRP
jgi:guanylate kinase